jgi:hypothetical protein
MALNNRERRRWIEVLFRQRHHHGLASPRAQFITSKVTIHDLVQDIRRSERKEI